MPELPTEAKKVPAISTFNLLGKLKFPENTATPLELYTVFGIVAKTFAAEGGRGANLVLRGQFGALVARDGEVIEFRAPKAYLPDELAETLADQFKALKQVDKRAELQFIYRVRAIRSDDAPLGYVYDFDHVHTGKSDPFAMVREVVLQRTDTGVST